MRPGRDGANDNTQEDRREQAGDRKDAAPAALGAVAAAAVAAKTEGRATHHDTNEH